MDICHFFCDQRQKLILKWLHPSTCKKGILIKNSAPKDNRIIYIFKTGIKTAIFRNKNTFCRFIYNSTFVKKKQLYVSSSAES